MSQFSPLHHHPSSSSGHTSHLHAVSSDIEVISWQDPVVDKVGYTIDDPYVEMFWLPVLGPTATWLARRLASGLSQCPQGYTVHLPDLARSIGVTYTEGKHNPFARAIQRCVMFGVAKHLSIHPHSIYAVRQVLPTVPLRHLNRLPEQLRIAHHDWMHDSALVCTE